MDKKTQFIFRVILGAIIIAASIFLSFKFLMRGNPFIKVMAIGLIAGTAYLVIDYLIKKTKNQ